MKHRQSLSRRLQAVASYIAKARRELATFDWPSLLDFAASGQWPGVVRSLVVALVFGCSLVAGHALILRDLSTALERLAAEQEILLNTLRSKERSAAPLADLTATVDEMASGLARSQGALAVAADVPKLIDAIAVAATDNGLELLSVAREEPLDGEFFQELPIAIEVSGDYHGVGQFFSDIASLEKLITPHDFAMTGRGAERVNLGITMRAYLTRLGSAGS